MKINNHHYLKLLCLLFFFGLAACSSTNGPVVIRDVNSLPVIETDAEVAFEEKQQVVIAQPVVPNQQRTKVPLIEKLISQANQQLINKNYNSAINLSERGLRIDRKEPHFYLVLAKAYERLSNKKQSNYFAKQGLRYASKESDVFVSLQKMSK